MNNLCMSDLLGNAKNYMGVDLDSKEQSRYEVNEWCMY